MAQWLISYQFRRVYRSSSGDLGYSNQTSDRIEFTTTHPAAFVANAAIKYAEFTNDNHRQDSSVCDLIERIHSVVYVPDDVLSEGQQHALEDAYTDGPREDAAKLDGASLANASPEASPPAA
jgi:hypothetical protein